MRRSSLMNTNFCRVKFLQTKRNCKNSPLEIFLEIWYFTSTVPFQFTLKHLTLANNSSIFPVFTCGTTQATVLTIQERFFKATAVYILHKNWTMSLVKESIMGSIAYMYERKWVCNVLVSIWELLEITQGCDRRIQTRSILLKYPVCQYKYIN